MCRFHLIGRTARQGAARKKEEKKREENRRKEDRERTEGQGRVWRFRFYGRLTHCLWGFNFYPAKPPSRASLVAVPPRASFYFARAAPPTSFVARRPADRIQRQARDVRATMLLSLLLFLPFSLSHARILFHSFSFARCRSLALSFRCAARTRRCTQCDSNQEPRPCQRVLRFSLPCVQLFPLPPALLFLLLFFPPSFSLAFLSFFRFVQNLYGTQFPDANDPDFTPEDLARITDDRATIIARKTRNVRRAIHSLYRRDALRAKSNFVINLLTRGNDGGIGERTSTFIMSLSNSPTRTTPRREDAAFGNRISLLG